MSSTQTQSLTAYAAFCRERIDLCDDLIKQLRGELPAGCTLTFGIREIPVVRFDVADSETWFMLSFFMGWRKYYVTELQRVQKEMAA